MDTVSIIIPLIVLAFIGGIAALIVWTMRRGNVVVDIRQIYFYLVALATLLLSFVGALQLVGQILTLFLPYSETDFIRRQIANTLGLLLMALPVWWFHWQHAQRRALQTQRHFGLRVYLYMITVIALIVAVIIAGKAGTEIFKTLFGLVDFSNAESIRSFWRDELSALVNVFIALAVWYYHWHTVERIPTTNH